LQHIVAAVAAAREHRQAGQTRERAELRADVVTAGIALLALYSLGLALVMVVAPHSFFQSIGPFGRQNDHYIRDTATFSAAIGVGLAVALRHASWRVPMLAISTVQFALHSINHLVDIDAAHPAWKGYFDFFSLAASTFLIGGLLWLALAEARTRASGRKGGLR
jgi:hypothetical protein